jgi:glycosyltransferase involved in cell wall biosynthesis
VPNVEAVALLERDAPAYSAAGVNVLAIGRCSLGREPVVGVEHKGEVPDIASYLQAADIALCPLVSGSGTSLKVIEYLAAGLPLVSTDVGVRGLGIRAGIEAEICGTEEMASRVASLVADPARMSAYGVAARAAVAERFSWDTLGRTATAALDDLVGSRANHVSPVEPRG